MAVGMQLRMPTQGEPLSIILKPAGSRCNLDCLYCYDKRRDLADSGYLKTEDLRSLLKSCSGHPLTVTLHGGESLVTPDTVLQTYFEVLREHDADIQVGIVTNGTLLTEERLNSLLGMWPGLGIAISYDGPSLASRYRVDFNGRPTGNSVERTMRMLNEVGQPFSVMTVVTQANKSRAVEILDTIGQLDKVELVRFLPCLDYDVEQSKAGARYRSPGTMSLIRSAASGTANWALDPDEYTDFVLSASNHWAETGLYKKFVLEPFVSVVTSAAGGDSGYTDFSWRKQPYIVVLSASGIVSTSDEFEGANAYLCHARDLTESVESHIARDARDLWNSSEQLMERCKSCSYMQVCRGGNLPDRIAYGAAESKQDEYCEARKRLIDGVRALETANLE